MREALERSVPDERTLVDADFPPYLAGWLPACSQAARSNC